MFAAGQKPVSPEAARLFSFFFGRFRDACLFSERNIGTGPYGSYLQSVMFFARSALSRIRRSGYLRLGFDFSYMKLFLDKSHDVWGNSRMNGKSDKVCDTWNFACFFGYSF